MAIFVKSLLLTFDEKELSLNIVLRRENGVGLPYSLYRT
jgi:hypothetical protein